MSMKQWYVEDTQEPDGHPNQSPKRKRDSHNNQKMKVSFAFGNRLGEWLETGGKMAGKWWEKILKRDNN